MKKRFILIDQSIIATGGHYLQYAESVLENVGQFGFKPYLIVNKRLSETIAAPYDVLPLFSYTYWESLGSFRLPERERSERFLDDDGSEACYKANCFAFDLYNAMQSLQVDADDVIFIPTISEVEMEGLLALLKRNMFGPLPVFHVLFRRNIFECRSEGYENCRNQHKAFRACLRGCELYAKLGRIYFYTDTDDLTVQYNTLSACRFTTLPIPHTIHSVSAPDEIKMPYNIVYLGDARQEKGYQYLPAIANELYDDFKREHLCKFILQSNYNVPGGEAGIPESRSSLEAMDKEYVQVISEALPSEEYKRVFENTQVMLILYDSLCYYVRSSGIFAEAMSAGIPCVIPANTWMSRQIYPYLYAHYHAQVEKYAEKTYNTCLKKDMDVYKLSVSKPEKASCAMIELGVNWIGCSECISAQIVQLDVNGTVVDCTVEYIEKAGFGKCYFPIVFVKEAVKVQITINSVYDTPLPIIKNAVIVEFSPSVTHIPRGAVCAVFANPDEVGNKIKDILNDYDYFKQTAIDFAEGWRKFHNPQTLLKLMLNNTCGKSSLAATEPVKFSVIIPVYNKQEHLQDCLNSILSQTLGGIEIICVDDGSTDQSSAILREYQNAFDNIRVYAQNNSGPGVARNLGLSHAQGEFVAFMDADDLYPSNDVLDVLYMSAKKHNVSIAGGDMVTADGWVPYSYPKSGVMEFAKFQEDTGYTRFIYKRSLLSENNIIFPELRYYEDPVFFLKAMLAARRYYYTTKPVYYYRNDVNRHVALPPSVLADQMTGISVNMTTAQERNCLKLYNTLGQRICTNVFYSLCASNKELTSDVLEQYITLFKSIDTTLLNKSVLNKEYINIERIINQLLDTKPLERVHHFSMISKKIIQRKHLNMPILRKVWQKIKRLNYRLDTDSRNEVLESIEQSRREITRLKAEMSETHSRLLSEFSDLKEQMQQIKLQLLATRPTSRKRILIVGYYGAPNFGDEMMLDTLLKKLLPGDDIEVTVMLAENPLFDVSVYGRVNVIQFPKSLTDYNVLANHLDGVILGGGAHLNDHSFDDMKPYLIPYNRSILEIAVAFALQRKPCICLGLSANQSLHNEEYIQKLDFLVKNATYFSLRDELSLKTIEAAGIQSTGIQIINDIACANPVFINTKWNSIKPEPYTLGIIWYCDQETYDALTALLNAIESRMDEAGCREYSIKLIPFFEPDNNDTLFYQKVYRDLEEHIKRRISILPYIHSPGEVCRIFKETKVMINLRYHAAVINGMLGNIGINIAYDLHAHYYTKMKKVADMFPESINLKYSKMSIDAVAQRVTELMSADKRSKVAVDIAEKAAAELDKALCLLG